jgi:putative holliday junction resolvase
MAERAAGPQALERYNQEVKQASPSAADAAQKGKPAGKILAIDYGRARIGLAIAESRQGVARPFTTLERINRNEDMRRLRELVRQQGVRFVLVGLPLRMDGTRGEMAEEAERFAERVRKQVGVAVEMMDERLTSWEAERQLEEQFGRRSKSAEASSKKKANEKISVDSMAAAILLREYLGRQDSAAQREGRSE